MIEMKEGYKDSEVGVIPVEWEVTELKNISKITMGQSPKSDTYNTNNIGIPLIQGNADCKNRKTIPRTYTTDLTKECFIEDIIMTVRAPVGAISKSLHNACIGRGVCAIKSKEDNEYIYHCLVNYEEKWDKLSQGSTFTAVSGSDIKNLKFPLPPIKEQEKIADILSTADEKIDTIAIAINKAEILKTGLLQKLLSEGLGHSEFKDSELGTIPKNWEVERLGDIGSFKNGINKDKEDFGFGNKFFNLLDVFGLAFIKNEPSGLVNVSSKEQEDFNILKGDTFFIRSSVKPSGVGLTAVLLYAPINTVYSGFIIRFRDNNKLELNFKKYCFYDVNFRKRLLAKSSVSANTNINQEALKSLLIKLPPLKEQKQIAEILSTADKKIEILKAKKEKYKTLKKGLLQKLLSGEIRV